MRPVPFLLLLGVLVHAATAQDAPLVVEFRALEAARRARDAARAAVSTDDGAASRRALAGAEDSLRRAAASFHAAFARSRWRDLDPKTHRGILEEGLFALGTGAIESDPKVAVEALEKLTGTFPRSTLARRAWVRQLSRAYLAAGRLGRATAHMRQVVAEAGTGELPRLRLRLGDLLAAAGDETGARLEFSRAASAGAPRLRAQAEFRLALVGRKAHDIDERPWIGADPAALSSFRGRIVVLDFWATWCPSCRKGLTLLDDLQAAHPAGRLRVLGVTRFYPKGYEPRSRRQLLEGGRRVTGMDDAAFFIHLRTFRDRAGIHYPFVVADPADFKRYRILGVPTTVVVDGRRIVRLAVLGTRAKLLVRVCVERLLNRLGD